MGSSFEDLVASSPTVKTVFQSNKQFELHNILSFRIFTFNVADINNYGSIGMHAKIVCTVT